MWRRGHQDRKKNVKVIYKEKILPGGQILLTGGQSILSMDILFIFIFIDRLFGIK